MKMNPRLGGHLAFEALKDLVWAGRVAASQWQAWLLLLIICVLVTVYNLEHASSIVATVSGTDSSMSKIALPVKLDRHHVKFPSSK